MRHGDQKWANKSTLTEVMALLSLHHTRGALFSFKTPHFKSDKTKIWYVLKRTTWLMKKLEFKTNVELPKTTLTSSLENWIIWITWLSTSSSWRDVMWKRSLCLGNAIHACNFMYFLFGCWFSNLHLPSFSPSEIYTFRFFTSTTNSTWLKPNNYYSHFYK